jgi:hypothetical protein
MHNRNKTGARRSSSVAEHEVLGSIPSTKKKHTHAKLKWNMCIGINLTEDIWDLSGEMYIFEGHINVWEELIL